MMPYTETSRTNESCSSGASNRMKHCIWALCALFLFLAPATASQVVSSSIPSPKLGRAMAYQIYLPESFKTGVAPLPIVYLLHGAAGNAQTWTKLGNIKTTLDHLIATGQIPRVVVVMPGCFKCWWIDGAELDAESALWNDFIPAIERRYTTRRDGAGRYFAGLSAGGYAVIRYALKYPERMAAAAALSPAIYRGAPPSFSAARSNPPFLNPDGKFNLASWRRENYPRYLPNYIAQSARVPLYLLSGRQDHFGIAHEVKRFYNEIQKHQPKRIKLQMVDGGHTWRLWANTISGALVYMLNRPQQPPSVR